MPVPKTSRRFLGQPKSMGFHGFRHHKTCGFVVKEKSGHKSGHKMAWDTDKSTHPDVTILVGMAKMEQRAPEAR
jgi:hypothetical protein